MLLTFAADAEASPVALVLLPSIVAIVVFTVAFLVLKSQVWPKITSALDDREDKILGEIKAAEEAREKADAARSEFESSLAEARRESAEMISQARGDAKRAGEELRVRNEADLAEMKDRARRDIESARADAVAEIHREATQLASAMASRILQREINVEDQQQLLDESLKELASVRS